MNQLLENFRGQTSVPELPEMMKTFVETATTLVISELGEHFDDANVLTTPDDASTRRFAAQWSFSPEKTTFDPQDPLDKAICEAVARCISAEFLAEFDMNARMGRGNQKFAPYILLAPTAPVIDPDTGNVMQSFITRYAYR